MVAIPQLSTTMCSACPAQVKFNADLKVINECLDDLITRAKETRQEEDMEALQARDYSKVGGWCQAERFAHVWACGVWICVLTWSTKILAHCPQPTPSRLSTAGGVIYLTASSAVDGLKDRLRMQLPGN
jgi:hypothetical protein